MDQSDIQPFLETLNEMGEFFSDELSELRQRTYWRLVGAVLTLEEWRAACETAMAKSAFHKVPLPGELLAYATEYRTALKALHKAAAAAADARQIPERTETTDAFGGAQCRAIVAKLEGTMTMPAGVLRAAVDLEYVCQEPDPAARKAHLHAQARQVQAETAVVPPPATPRFWHFPDDGRPI